MSRIPFKSIVVLILALFIVAPLIVGGLEVKIDNPLEADSFSELIKNIADFIFTIAIWVAPVMYMIGGGYFLIAGGDPQKVETGKKLMVYTSIGLIIAVAAKGLIGLFETVFLKK